MSWRGAALALAAVIADLAVTSCAGARRWAADEAERIDAIIAGDAPGDAGVPLSMGPAPPLAAPAGAGEPLSPATPWSDPPHVRGSRWSLGRRHRSQRIGRDSATR